MLLPACLPFQILCVFQWLFGPLGFAQASSCSVIWLKYWDKWSKQTYCFRADPSPDPNTPFSNRTYADASADCMALNSKLATHHDQGADNMFPSDGSSRWIGVKYERDLEMYTYNDGVPMDTSWLSWTPWDTVGGHPNNGRGNLDCTVIANGKWRSVSCTDTFRFVCEYQECPDGWTYNPHVDRCNKHFFWPITFQSATESCSRLGAIVETARSVAAQRFLFDLGSETLISLWIGLMNIAEEPVWRWNDGAKVTWTAWDGTTSVLGTWFQNQNCMFALKNESSTIWKRTHCTLFWKAYVCGKATCRFPYQSIVAEGHSPFFHKCYRGMMGSRLNARQAGQFCAEDGSKSNPSRLAAPITQLEDDILHKRGKNPTARKRGNERYMFFNYGATNYGRFNYDKKWIGHVFNIYEFKNRWQWNDNTIGGKLANTSKSNSLDWVSTPNERRLEVCTMLRAESWTGKPCDRLYGFVCEREQPYVLSTCPPSEDLTNLNASLLNGYHPKVPQSQRMKCYYHHADARTMNYAEADRFCSSLGGYIMMPKTNHDLIRFIYQISHTNPNHLWIGADSFGHCYNNDQWCTPNPNNFKYQDGSSLTSNNLIWSNGQPDDLEHKEACIVVDRETSVIRDIDCSTLSKVVCEVDHNNLRTHRNFDYITACTYQKIPHVGAWNADIDEPRLNVPWHASPGDVCYRTPDSKGRGYKRYVDSCKSLETDSDTARPRDKDQTRSLVLSIMSTDVGLHVAPTSSYIGVWYWRVHTDKAKWLSTSYNGCPGSRWPPCDYEEFDAKFRNWSPDDTAPSGQRRSLKCVLIKPNGKWVTARCNEGHYVSCQKPSVASLITWRTDQAAQLPSADESCSDRLHIQIRSIAVVVIISLALCS